MYFRLTYKKSSDREQVGNYVLCGMKALGIGQSGNCEVRIPESKEYEPELFATIFPTEDGNGWNIVKRSDHCRLYINGIDIQIAHPLNSGDEIVINEIKDSPASDKSFVKLYFETFDNGDYNAANGVIYKQNKSFSKLSVATAVIAVAAVIIALCAVFKNDRSVGKMNFDIYSKDICRIAVDSVFLVCDSIVIESLALDNAARGTCFLTESGQFVTARHCIEPWINDEGWNGTVSDISSMSEALKLATKAETLNHESGEKRYSVRSSCIISYGMQQFRFSSTDFNMDKSRDQVLCLGDETQPIYWRTIIPVANRRNMELGDIACVNVENIKGNIELATLDDLRKFDEDKNKDIVIIGYPVNDNHTDMWNKIDGESQRFEWNDDTTNLAGCIQMSALINPGNSGGPIFALIDGEPKVIGIVSKADTYARQGVFWAVPTTEVLNINNHGSGIETDSLIFRR